MRINIKRKLQQWGHPVSEELVVHTDFESNMWQNRGQRANLNLGNKSTFLA